MQHYKVEQQSYGSLQTNYPHTPSDSALSAQDYLEDQLSQGFELVSTWDHANGPYFAFRVVAK